MNLPCIYHRRISFFLGGITIVLSFFVFFLLGTPREVMWLSANEKRMAAARIAVDQIGSDRQKRVWKKYQAWEAVADPQVRLRSMSVFGCSQ